MDNLETLVALAKRRGFIYPGSEIYGGLAGTWDYGPLGAALKNNIRDSWWRRFVASRENMYGLDTAILMNQKVWRASGHMIGFSDPLPEKPSQRFNLMFKTNIGAAEDEAAAVYLRPETAQGMFINFKNVVDSFHPKLPFGLAQIGKAFRNEIAPRDFIFRTREFEQMEIEYFVRPADWGERFEYWRKEIFEWLNEIGLSSDKIHELEVLESDRAHYSKRTIDFEFDFPFGRRELCGLAYRTDFDLQAHAGGSQVNLSYCDEEKKECFIPHVVEPSFGLDRAVLAVLCSAYAEDELGGEKRTVLKLPPALAPIDVAVFPLLRNKPKLVAKAREIYRSLKLRIASCKLRAVVFDDNGNIGKRYRRQDEIGTPWCVTVDFQTLEDGTVTVRDRDTGKQERVPAGELITRLG